MIVSSPTEIGEAIADLKFNTEQIKENVMDASVHIATTSYEMLLNMPVTDRDLMVKAYNKKVKKENGK